MEYLPNSEELVGYRVRIVRRPAIIVCGYTLIVPPRADEKMVPRFWDEIIADGRLEKLRAVTPERSWVLGLGSWDPECPKRGYRYTICIEETNRTDFSRLAAEYPLFAKEIGASDWMCFETAFGPYPEKFWKDNPYRMMGPLGYAFHTGGFNVGLHFEAYPPDFSAAGNPAMEFWITVVKVKA